MSIPEIYSKFNIWCDNQQKIAQMQNTYTSEELQENEEYQTLNNSTGSIFDINSTSVDNFFDSAENFFGIDKNKETFFDKTSNFINNLFGLKTEENYNKNIAQLGQGELLEKDTDENGVLSLEEYINAELADLEETATIEEKAMTAAYSHALFKILDEGTSVSDKNEELSAEELSSYYKNVDRFENGELTETKDGKFTSEDASGLTTFLIDNMIGQDNINALYDAYYKKYSLEAEI